MFKPKRLFEEMEPLIYESQQADENSERHEVEMRTPLLEKTTIAACQSINAFFYYLFDLLLTVY